MARYSLAFNAQVTVATNDTTALTTLKYTALGGNSGTMQLKVNEIQIGGEASVAAVQCYIFARDTTVAATSLTSVGLNNSLLDATATAPGTLALFSNSSTTFRQGEEITIIGNTQPLGECSYSGGPNTVASQVSGHVIYELV